MRDFDNIQDKLHGFILKYYKNEIIKGSILFLAIGLIYMILTLFVEHFLWLNPLGRTILFWIFILVEVGLCFRLIIIPLLKLLGLRNGITEEDASLILGKYFDEIDDKLINLLQLNKNHAISDLVLASIEQKSKDLKPIPFKKAIDFRINVRYIKFLAIPLVIFFFIFLTGNISVFTNSLTRVVHHQTAYDPPAPFNFVVLNKKFQIVEGQPFTIETTTVGEIAPEVIKIVFENEEHFMKERGSNIFYYKLDNVDKSAEFFLMANGIRSRKYQLEIIRTPNIINLEMKLEYPEYIRKEDEIIKNTGNASVPEGAKIEWIIRTKNTSRIDFITYPKSFENIKKPRVKVLKINEKDNFNYRKLITEDIKYEISSSNVKLKNYESLHYKIDLIKDQFPKIFIKTDLDSTSRGSINFMGQLSDDYGISHLQVIAQNRLSKVLNVHNIEVGKSDMENFFYSFPEGLNLNEGETYDIYFHVLDNDAINGPKMSKSEVFSYHEKTETELQKELLQEQEEQMKELKNSSNQFNEFEKDLNKFSNRLKKEKNTDWNNDAELEKFIKRQEEYQRIMENKRDNLLDNLEEMSDSDNPDLDNKKEELEERIRETMEMEEKEKLLRELKELSEKLKNENLLDKVDYLQNQTKQQERSLERILELTKRFYVEKKTHQLIKSLEKLSKEQKSLVNKETENVKEQNKIKRDFEEIQKDLDNLRKQNDELKKPMDIPQTKKEEENIQEELKRAQKSLEESLTGLNQKKDENIKKASKSQNAAAKKMNEMKNKMKSQMAQMGAESVEENIEDLEQILENLVVFSFDQEGLMLSMDGIDSKNAAYPERLKRQQSLKEHFEHIDDSLFTLSLRLVQLSSKIDKYIVDAHYNLDKSLVSITDNKIQNGITHQRYTMTSANDLADLLSDLLGNLKNNKPGNGQGPGKDGESIELPDIIKKQENILNKMKEGMESKQNGKGKTKEEMSGEQFEIYQEQRELRDQMNELIKRYGNDSKEGKNTLDKMEEMEKLLLEKGITKDLIRKMESLNHELLKLENANFEKGQDNRRRSETGIDYDNNRTVKRIRTRQKFIEENEILFRNSFELKPKYQEKLKVYFNQNN